VSFVGRRVEEKSLKAFLHKASTSIAQGVDEGAQNINKKLNV
jgi:hypothetical protein